MEDQQGHNGVSEEVVQLPAPTAFPLVLALGLTFTFAGLVTNMGISILGVVLIVAAAWAGFARCGRMRTMCGAGQSAEVRYTTVRTKVAHIEIDESHRARLPVHTHRSWPGSRAALQAAPR